MRTAICTQDNVTYTANDFNLAMNFETKKRFLVCSQCEGPAFYRAATRNGREACFGARHVDGCNLATLEHDSMATGHGNVEDEIFTAGQRIIVDFNFGTQPATLETQPVGGLADNGNQRGHHEGGTAVRDIMHRRISSLLRCLIESEEFRRSTQILEVAGQGEFSVADFFVKFDEITEEHIGSYHGYWGMVPDAERDRNGTLWFNSGGPEDMSALLDQSHVEEVFRHFRIDNEGDIAGAEILVFGELRRSQNSGKKHVVITDPSCVTIKLAY